MGIFIKNCYKFSGEVSLILLGNDRVMEQKQSGKFRAWFDKYAAGFYGDDEYVNANINLKQEHSKRTCKEMLYLAGELGLDEKGRRIAEAIALFHDIGRFEQFVRCRTYNDTRSLNHCLLGVEVLKKTGVLECLEREERELIEKAVEYHGVKELPGDLNGECLLFSKMIRDADKLDIFYVVTEYYRQYRDNPEDFKLEIEFPDEPGYSEEVLEEVLCGRRIDYGLPRTLNDIKLLQVAWVYDVNFAATLKRIRQRKFMEKIIEFLPRNEDIERVKEKILEYIDGRIEKGV